MENLSQQEKSKKAIVTYRSGLMLMIPKDNNAPLLFLEWLSQKRASSKLIHKIINDEDCFKIRLYAIKEDYMDCAEYINSNL